ncbi:RlpA-like double-psi beta-barrel-protein domain-containing protein-containing protein [Absidia repens]|uniref:RlpA-like double-psi beta-barrel-protein domain-containing protein-containing protein n=1 Tax=Absidia repens TaxID=90262 RepID=A0A1X2ISP9_9FUNG|nr:RlpA-like double-psi beta-barrel-protein domain-containing protein-containing protein [Absidia repens]
MSFAEHNNSGITQQAVHMADASVSQRHSSTPSISDHWEKEQVPHTIWTQFIEKYRFGKAILVSGGITGVFVIMFVVLGSLKVFSNSTYRGLAGIPSVGSSKYDGDSWGTATEGHFDMGGKGDGTYYDPGVGITSCGGSFTAQDMIVALNHVDYGRYADPNESPACGACIKVTGPLGSAKATIQDMCPGCNRGSLDLSPQVFAAVGNFADGRIPVSWTSC